MRTLVSLAAALALLPGPAGAGPGLGPPGAPPRLPPGAPRLLPPVDGTITRRFTPPAVDWGPGHRGIDYAAAPGTDVRAAAEGEVTFAGAVGAVNAVTIAHRAGLATTYSALDDIFVALGDWVEAGDWVGATGAAHPGGPGGGLHFGVKVGSSYADPEAYLGALEFAGTAYLVPDAHVHAGEDDRRFNPQPLDDGSRDCVRPEPVGARPPPPTGNIVIVLGGHDSAPGSPVFSLPVRLGYAPADVYRFSYRGLGGPRFFEPYERDDTHGSLRAHALRLHDLLRRIGKRHPGRAVDVFGHSQGGLIAREALARLADEWDPSVAPVENLVTYAAPHGGIDAVAAREILVGGTATSLLLDGLEVAGAANPWAPALDDMAPESPYLDDLARSDVTAGTRVLALAMPHDLFVPAHRARWEGKLSRTVPPSGWSGHRAIVDSGGGDAFTYTFLRGATPCDLADGLGDDVGKAVATAHYALPALLRATEEAAKEIARRNRVAAVVIEIVGALASLRRYP